jgi:hypothetical protein
MHGIFEMTFPTSGGTGILTTYNSRYINHGIVMWISWFILGILMIGTNRWFPYFSNYNNYIHAFTGYCIVAMNSNAALNIIALNRIKPYGLHNILGLLLSIGLVFFAATGTIAFIAKKNL